MRNDSRKWLWVASLAVAMGVLAGCSRQAATTSSKATSAPVMAATLTTVVERNLPTYADFPGSVRSADHIEVASRLMGYIQALRVHEGEQVKAGQLLLTIDPSDAKSGIAQAQANLDQAKAALANAAANERRYKTLYAQQAVPAQQYQQVHTTYLMAQGRVAAARAALATARQQLHYAEVRAPFAGTVVSKSVSAGQLASPGQPLLALEGATHLQVVTQLSGQAFDHLKLGQRVMVKIHALGTGSQTLAGAVERLVSATDPVTHTHSVKIALPANSPVHSGAYVRVRVVVGHHQGIMIPLSAVHRRGGITGVFVADESAIVHFRMVRLGQQIGDQVAVLAGLASGEQIVVSARGTLDNGVHLKVEAGS